MKKNTLSIVIPLLNEAESLTELIEKIESSCHSFFDIEVLFIDDGSSDQSWEIILRLQKKYEFVKGFRFHKNFGKAAALHVGFGKATGKYIATLDADLQDDPAELKPMIEQLEAQSLDLVSGWKKIRYDNVIRKNLPSKLFNWAARKTSGIKLHDFNCGIKVYRNEVVKNIELHGDMHRYIPVLAKNAGFSKIGEKAVIHQARKYGTTKFGMERFTRGFLDLLTIWFLSKFGKRPMHLFGMWGSIMFILGFSSAFYLGFKKLLQVFYYKQKAILITDNPFFFIALAFMIIGTQLFLAGFLGELILRTKKDKKEYNIRETVG